MDLKEHMGGLELGKRIEKCYSYVIISKINKKLNVYESWGMAVSALISDSSTREGKAGRSLRIQCQPNLYDFLENQ